MKKLLSIVLIMFVLAIPGYSIAASTASDAVIVIDPYVRMVPPGQTISAAFMQMENSSDTIHAVVSASSTVSKVVELHAHIHENGMMKMRRIEKMEIPAHGKTVLEPGELHIMLIDLHGELKLDQKVSITLKFEDGSTKVIEAPVRKIMMRGMMKNMKH